MPGEQMATLTIREPIIDLSTKYALSSACLFCAAVYAGAKGLPALRISTELPYAESFSVVYLRDSRELEGCKP